MTIRIRSFLVLSILVAAAGIASAQVRYPETPTVDQVDDYHGTKVADPYRWLEEDVRSSKRVADWVAAENAVTFSYLAAIPARERLKSRLRELLDYERVGAPIRAGKRWLFQRNDGLQNQSVLYVMDALDGEPRVLIDPNRWSEDGTVALAGMAPSPDGRYLAYGVAEAGSDWRTWHVMEIATGRVLEDALRWVKFSGASWTKDGKGFFYGRFEPPNEGAAFQSLNLGQKLCYHRVGTSQSDDVVVYERPDQPSWGFGHTVSDDGRYLVITVWKGTANRYRILVKDLHEPYGMPVELIGGFDNEYAFIGNDGTTFWFKTDLEAPRGRVVAVDVAERPLRFREVIPEADDALTGVNLVGNMFVARYLHDARTAVRLFGTDGRHVRDVELPGIGTAIGFGGRPEDTLTFYTFSSFNRPPTIYRYDLLTGRSVEYRRTQVDFDPEAYEVRQVFYESKDGTRVPMFITARKGLKLDGNNPTLLYGYGGFNISLTPRFSATRIAWLELGGVLAIPNLRGGGEYGEEWHRAGTKLRKQNVFDDFIAAAEWLIENGYTRPEKLAIQGGSNGGLLVGAVMTQRPDLFGACLPAVGVMDMLRFQKFTAGRFWVDDYGSSDDPEEFKALLAYSPYHNLKEGTRYPATLVTTADHDDRVVPGHSFKFAARLQKCQAGPAPVLIRIETRAGHGAGKPTEKVIEEVADSWAFLVKNLGIEMPPEN